VRESVEIIRGAGATVAGVVIALDRQEKGQNQMSAVQEVSQQFGIPVLAIISLAEIIEFIEQDPDFIDKLEIISSYRQQYGI
jgi:orotate phosphoribosyltransferase